MITKKNMMFRRNYLPASFTGCLLTLCFPKFQFWGVAFFAMVPLLISISILTPKQAFYSGLIAGFIHFTTLIYWIVPTLNQYGGLHPALSVSALILLCLYLAVYPAIFTYVLRKTDMTSAAFPLLAACLWTGLEYIRTYAFTGFAWGVLGYSQHTNRVLIQMADLTGVYGISFIIILVNCFLAGIWLNIGTGRLKTMVLPAIYTLTLVGAVMVYGFLRTDTIDTLIEKADRASVGIVQGNIDQAVKWDGAFKTETVKKYIRLSKTLFEKKPDLVVWPEAALPFYYGFDKPLSDRVDELIRSADTYFLIGSPAFDSVNGDIRYFNRAYMLHPDAAKSSFYDKRRLVPFGEYVPFGDYLNFLGKITAQAGDFSPGTQGLLPLEFSGHRTGVLICFEILFPDVASGFVRNQATFLTTLTNDAWFGYTSAARQHFSIAVFRAIENRRSLIRAANTGISGFIDPVGRTIQETDLFTDAAIIRTLPGLKLNSFYTRYNDLFTWFAMVAFFLLFMLKRIKQ